MEDVKVCVNKLNVDNKRRKVRATVAILLEDSQLVQLGTSP